MRCPLCNHFEFKSSFPFQQDPNKSFSVEEYQSSRCAGCLGCGVILDAVEAAKPGWADAHPQESVGWRLDGCVLVIEFDGETFEVFQSQGVLFINCNRVIYNFISPITLAFIALSDLFWKRCRWILILCKPISLDITYLVYL